jgi:peptidoglycan-N-acetylglucosamine deacetylase
MPYSETRRRSRSVEIFYNDLAPTYDHEQFQTAVSISKHKEYELFSARLPELFAVAGRVLEIGAGTGIFTIPIARLCREVIAVDISPNMLGLLEKKAAVEGVTNIRTILCDVEKSPPEGTFSVICAFASFEYIADLPGLLRRLAPHLEPGGVIYFITARRSFLRFFTQLGNAVRQGMWLKAHSRAEIKGMLLAAGFTQIEINSHLFKLFRYGGMLLEVVARRAADTNVSAAHNEEF